MEKKDPITRLEQDPLGFVRSKSRRVAEILEDEFHDVPQIGVIFTFLQDSTYIGDLIQAIGTRQESTTSD